MIYTSYFAKYSGSDGVSVSVTQPSGCSFPVFYPLVPDSDLVWGYKNGKITEDEYKAVYFKQLESLNPKEIAQKLDGKVLLCWEGKDKFCHRHLIAEWLNKHGIPCKEQKLIEFYFTETIVPETCLYCKYSDLIITSKSFVYKCRNKKSRHFQKKTKKPQRSTCKRWEGKF